MSQAYQKAMDDLDRFLHQPGFFKDLFDKIEQKSPYPVKRIYLAQGVLVLFVLYMVFGYFAQLVCNFVGFVYPAYVSIKAVESSSKEDDTKWLTYWVVFAFFSIIDFFSSFVLSWFPFYWLAKVIFLVWCYLPIESNGTDYIYKRVIRPMFLKNTGRIDAKINSLTQKVSEKINDAMKDK